MSDDERRELRAYPADRAGGDLGRPAASEREQADIAQLLRALNDDLRDEPRPRGPEAPASSAPTSSAPSMMRLDGRRPSALMVGVAIIAAAAIGLGSLLFTGSNPAPSSAGKVISANPGNEETPPPLIARAGGESAPVSTLTPGSVAPPSGPVVVSPSQVPTAPRLLTPGQTATIVRPTPVEPPPEPAPSSGATAPAPFGGATVVVQPLPVQPSAPTPTVSPPPAPRNVAPAPVKPVPAAAPPKPVHQPAPAAAPPPSAPHAGATPGGPGRYAVQVGTFSVTANAEQLARRLGQNGKTAYVVDWQDRQGRTWKAVRVGNFASDSAARAAASEIKAQMDLTGQLIDLR